MDNNNALVRYLTSTGALKTPRIIRAFRAIDRADFVLPEYKDEAYFDEPLPIGYGQTISQPSVVAFMLELLSPRKGNRVLDVGAGSGWTTALLAHIVGTSGLVRGVEIIPELVSFGRANLARYTLSNATIAHAADTLGAPEHAPFDRILVSAESADVPKELIRQLKVRGRMVIPVEGAIINAVRTSGTGIKTERYEGFAFVPLVSK